MLAGIYHMARFGFKGFVTIASTVLFVMVAVLMLAVSATYISNVDWSTQISFFGSININEPPMINY
jgi:hypothetical protein